MILQTTEIKNTEQIVVISVKVAYFEIVLEGQTSQ